jgi:DNA-binding MarR family transcriptional regulator
MGSTPRLERPHEAARLEDLLSWRLGVAGRLVRAIVDARLGLEGVGAQGTAVLMRLLERDGLTQRDLARLQYVEGPTVCRMIDRLAQDGLVERRPHPADRRATCVHLTPGGRVVAERGRDLVPQIEDETFSGLGAEDRAALADLLAQVLERLRPDRLA